MIKHNLPVPLIGSGYNFYQMVSDRDCARAIYLSIKAGCPSSAFNLGSNINLNVKNLIKNLIISSHSKSLLIAMPSNFVKFGIKLFNIFGVEILFKEQYELADKNFVVDTTKANKILNWFPEDDDKKMLKLAFKYWIERKT